MHIRATTGKEPPESYCSIDTYLLLGKVCENKCAFFGGKLVLLLSGLLQQLLPHHSEHRTQQRPAEDLCRLIPG